MKSPERQLHEWLIDEIAFDVGGTKSVFTKEEISKIAEALSQGSFAYLRMSDDILLDDLRHCRTAWDAFRAAQRPHPKIEAQWLIQFSNVTELMFVLMNLLEVNTEAAHASF